MCGTIDDGVCMSLREKETSLCSWLFILGYGCCEYFGLMSGTIVCVFLSRESVHLHGVAI